jgi:O-acetyl-ADP-ribose deacetylase
MISDQMKTMHPTLTIPTQKYKLNLIQADITQIPVDAMVNAANKWLRAGGGVDGVIHHAAGPELVNACTKLGGCETGEAKITKGYKSKAKYIIHTVGPIFQIDETNAERLLKDCYLNSLKLADKYALYTISFPSISTGAFGYPKEKATEIALNTVQDFFDNNATSIKEVNFVNFTETDNNYYIQQAKIMFSDLNVI